MWQDCLPGASIYVLDNKYQSCIVVVVAIVVVFCGTHATTKEAQVHSGPTDRHTWLRRHATNKVTTKRTVRSVASLQLQLQPGAGNTI